MQKISHFLKEIFTVSSILSATPALQLLGEMFFIPTGATHVASIITVHRLFLLVSH